MNQSTSITNHSIVFRLCEEVPEASLDTSFAFILAHPGHFQWPAGAMAKAKPEDANALPQRDRPSGRHESSGRNSHAANRAEDAEPLLALVHDSDYIPPVSALVGFYILHRRRVRGLACPAC